MDLWPAGGAVRCASIGFYCPPNVAAVLAVSSRWRCVHLCHVIDLSAPDFHCTLNYCLSLSSGWVQPPLPLLCTKQIKKREAALRLSCHPVLSTWISSCMLVGGGPETWMVSPSFCKPFCMGVLTATKDGATNSLLSCFLNALCPQCHLHSLGGFENQWWWGGGTRQNIFLGDGVRQNRASRYKCS